MTTSSPSRKINTPNIPNLRSLGGLMVANGLFKDREVYRSVELSVLNSNDFPAFEALGIRTVYDLRTSPEITSSPDNLPEGVRSVHLNVLADDSTAAAASLGSSTPADAQKINAFLAGGKADQLMEQSYREIVSSASGLASYKAFFEDLANPQRTGAALFHCTTGKDRTGWAAAALLTLLGANKETVYQDYLETNTDITAFTQPILEQAVQAGVDGALLAPILGVKKEYLDTAFQEVEEKFGSFDGYISNGLRLDGNTVSALHNRFIIAYPKGTLVTSL